MSRKLLFTITAFIAVAVGAFALLAPGVLVTQVKLALPSDAANVMARTVGVLLITMGVLDFLVRDHPDSPTLRAILAANLVLQLGIMPIDPLAWLAGTFHTLGSFVPNTILHLLLASAFAVQLARARSTSPSADRA